MTRHTGAGIAVLWNDHILLIRRGDNSQWDIPGGGTQEGEMPEDAARRELHEETGLSVGPLRLLGVFPHQHSYPDGNTVDWQTHLFSAQFSGGAAQAGDDASEVRWWPLSALPHDVSDATHAYFASIQPEPRPV